MIAAVLRCEHTKSGRKIEEDEGLAKPTEA